MDNITINLNNLLKQKGLKQTFVAEKANISPNILSKILGGKRKITGQELVLISEVLAVDPRELNRPYKI